MGSAVVAFALSLIASAAGEGKAKMAWTRDDVRAYQEAEERRQPLLIHFRGGNCGGRGTPGATEDRAGTGQAGGISRPLHMTDLSECDLMEQEVWEADRVARAAERFARVLVDSGDQHLNVRYQVVVNPTTLVTDPWGNEMLRVAGYLDPDKMERILSAVPRDFSALVPWARALRENGADLKALMGAAAFYESQGLRQVSERLYERAQGAAATDPIARRQASLARGLNLLMMGRGQEAARVFGKALEEAPDQPGADALLLGLVNAHLTTGKRKEAGEAYARMSRQFPDSPYTRRAKENLDSARK
jgi:tetratricopeptide (TPR) repeat protein